MKKFISVTLIAALLVGCGEDKTENQSKTTTAGNQPDILTYVPADSPLLLTSGLNPDQYPDRYLDVMESNMEGAVKYLKVMLQNAMKNANSYAAIEEELGGDEDSASATPSESDQMKEKAMAFVDQWIFQENFAKVGMKVGETQLAAYMVDLFPVLRIKLSQGHQVEAMLDDLQQQFEVPFVSNQLGNAKVREFSTDKMTLLVALENDYLVISGAPNVIKDQLVGQLIGNTKPTNSLAQNPAVINQIKQAHGYVLDDIMLLDFQAIADHFINPSKHDSALVNFLQIEDNMLSMACKNEITAMIAKAPRMVAGSTELSNDTINASFVWEMDQNLSQDMASMAGRIPHGNQDAAFAFGMSFDINNAKNVAAKYMADIVDNPYACEHLMPMNAQAAEMQAKLSQPLPPFVGNFKGFNFSLDELKLNMAEADLANPNPKEMIESLKTQIFLSVDETEALLGMAQMMVPQLQGMEIKTDGSLITLADQVPMISGKDIPFDVKNLYAAISDETIGVSLGHPGGGELSEKVREPGKNIMMSFSADVDGYKNLLEQVFSMADMPDMPLSIKEELEMQKELTLSMLYWQRQDVSLSFTEQGFESSFDIKY